MERTDNVDARRGRTGRGGRRTRTRGGLRSIGRPSVSDPIFDGIIDDLPSGLPLETPRHPRRVRVLKPKLPINPRIPASRPLQDEENYSFINYGSEEESDKEEDDVLQAVVVPRVAIMYFDAEDEEVEGDGIPIKLEWPPPSQLHLTSGSTSALPTPASPTPITPAPTSPNSVSPTPMEPNPRIPASRPLQDEENYSFINYGSEEESDKEENDVLQAVVVPRVARMYFDAEDEEVEGDGITIKLEWPPPSQLHLTSGSTSALPTPASPTPITPAPTSPNSVSPTPMEPSDKFKFVWRGFPTPQIEPRLRREPFSQINCGPRVSFTNPYDAFIAIWDREIMELMVRETNIYAQQQTTAMIENGLIHPNSRITRWQDTDVNELYTYLAIILAMGVVVKSRLEEYWGSSKDIFSTPGFSTQMSIDRFVLISRCLHFSNKMNINLASLSRSEAKLYNIRPILDHLNNKFSNLYILSQNIALDESLTMWKGWLDINQFIHNKVATVGIKTYEICESHTGYLWRFEVHAGHDTSALQENPVSGVVPALVLRLLNGLEHKGHTVWMDNFYNSPALARELKSLGFDCVGTLRTNRQFVPAELASLTKQDMRVGQLLGCTSGDVDLIVWRDKNRVALISTYHGLTTARCGETLKPTVVVDYNICMGGVDRKDQQLSMYPIERKRTRVWYKKFFKRLLNASVLNSYILLNSQALSHREFRKTLIIDLLTAHRKLPIATTPPANPAAMHFPAQYDLIKPGKGDRLKRKCSVCTKRTITYCKSCQLPMCIFTCFEPYHTSHSRTLTGTSHSRTHTDTSHSRTHTDTSHSRTLTYTPTHPPKHRRIK